MKFNYNSTTMSINPNENDTFYVMLGEIDLLKNDFPFKNDGKLMEKILCEITPSEEGDTVYNGNYKDWCNLINYIVYKYEIEKCKKSYD